ncbi:hypothetical protein [Flavobacterium ginsenosidimutans]|uniref:hypothetical protein n=1 Tax=Flavobacterium ginsenosidimutans TaxID=687844 RepID=UPI000DABD67F|nr:hypothetical protein [Flavobacterium ginsenosidimutans]KAF2331731.1 hypothetical protein DM444_11050 [Flavobacterium ginsenosidimutans]
MKSKFLFITLLLSSCTSNQFSGYVYDYDTNKPIQNVKVNVNGINSLTDNLGHFAFEIESNSACTLFLTKEGYASKKVIRKPDSLGTFSKRNLKNYKIYLYKNESDFSK